MKGLTISRPSVLAELAIASADIAVNAQKITGLADPASAQDAATKAYADAVAQGLDIKASVRAISTSNITLSGTQTQDGVALVAGNRHLAAGQTAAADNGIYVVAAGAWARATDANTSAKVNSGMYCWVEEGTVNGDSGWALITNDPITLNTTALVFSQFSGLGQVSATLPLVKTGNALTFDASGTPLTAAAFLATPNAPVFASSLAIDVGAKNDHYVGVLTGDITFTFTNPAVGRQGLIGVKQDGTGNRQCTFTPPATYTLLRDVGWGDYLPQPGINTMTLYSYSMFALGGTNYLLIGKSFLTT